MPSYSAATAAHTALTEELEAEYERLNWKDPITDEEEAYLRQLGHAKALLEVVDDLMFTVPRLWEST